MGNPAKAVKPLFRSSELMYSWCTTPYKPQVRSNKKSSSSEGITPSSCAKVGSNSLAKINKTIATIVKNVKSS